MAMNAASQPGQMDRNSSYLQLVDAFAWSLGSLEQQMVDAQETDDDPVKDTDPSLLIEIEGAMTGVCLQYPAAYGDGVGTSLSVLDKLIHTHPFWLLLSIDQHEVTDILLKQPAGVFLVWRSPVLQKKVLSFHMDGTSDSIIHVPVKESQYTFSLEESGIGFADLFHLVAFYCISRDILPCTLKLPEAVCLAETLTDLNELTQREAAFWKSSLNNQHETLSISESSLVQEEPLISLPSNCSEILQIEDPSHSCSNTCVKSCLSFTNPVFLQTQQVIAKDPTAANGKSRPPPPPRPRPPHILIHRPTAPPHPKTMPLSIGFNRPSKRSQASTMSKGSKQPCTKNPPPRPPQAPDIDTYRCTIALDDDTISRALSRANLPHTPLNQTSSNILRQWTGLEENGRSSSGRSLSTSSSDSLDSSPHPLPLNLSQSTGQRLSTDDSSDEYDEEEEDYGVELERDLHLRLSGAHKSRRLLAVELAGARPRSFVIFPRALRGHFSKVRGVLKVLATPEKRILLQIIELAQDKGSYFGCLVQDYLSYVQENKNCLLSCQDLLQTIRQFMTQMKAYLIQSSEINPPIESYVPEDQIDGVLEKAMHKCVLKPLYGSVQSALHDYQVSSGEWRRLQENLALAKTKQPRELGANATRPPDTHAINRIRRKLAAMRRMYSPERKIVVLLKVCKLIYSIMQDHKVRLFGADDFLPMLTYVLVQCDMPQLDTEILYMLELIDPLLLHGEGGYYLTSAYGAMSLIKNFQEDQAARILSSTTRDTLHQWHQRRTMQRNLPSVDDFQNYLRVALQKADSGCTAKTLQVRPYTTTEEMCRLCAIKFGVSDPENYALFLYTGDSSQQLAADTYPQRIKAELHSRQNPPSFHFVYRKTQT
ncbi:ras and Rab interactor 2-like [Paramisgurnus dabryanus]|uniref:ras and Rab interactor 2-like n=1 Tax=Paramisgurnus dabryanus TaxID=90735 RepID=UPI003CCF4B83